MCIRDRYNTCAVRENAEQKVFGRLGILKHIKEERKDMVIGVCGCMVQQEHLSLIHILVVLESDGTDFHHDFDGLEMYRQRKYGRTYITVYKKHN